MSKTMITPMEDFCGKEILENETVRRYFLSAVLRIPVEKISKTRILNPFLRLVFPGNKQGILDVLIELWDGRKINIEIQVAKMKYWDKRSTYYLARLFIQGYRMGGSYDKLKPCINISILDFNYLKTPEYHTIFKLRDKDGNDYSDVLEIHILELQKLNEEKECFMKTQTVVDEYDSAVKEWIMFFKCKSEEDVEMLKSKTTNIGIKEAIKELKTINLKDYLRARYEMRQKAISDQKAREEYVRDEGILETRRTDILEILEEYGDVSDLLKQRIMSEEDMDKLKNWHRLAARSRDADSFEKQMNPDAINYGEKIN